MTNTPYLALNAVKQALKLDGSELAIKWLATISLANVEKAKSFKSWLSNKDIVDLAQLTLNQDNEMIKSWLPGKRSVETKASYATFDGSRRDYAGHKHLFHSDTVFIAWETWNDDVRLSIYSS